MQSQDNNKIIYCPVCEREIVPEVVGGDAIYVHDEVPHEDEDIRALENRIQ